MPPSKFEHLGHKSLIIYLLGMTPPLVLIFILGVGVKFFESQLPLEIKPYLGPAYILLFIFFILLSLIACLIGYLRYITYKFALDEDALHIERGIINREIIAIPYRQIQNINVDRNLFNRLFGLSNLIITTAANEEKDTEGVEMFEAEGFLPYLDKDRAAEIQSELMKRTNVEKVMAINQSLK